MMSVVRLWDRLPRVVVDISSQEVFKVMVYEALKNMV